MSSDRNEISPPTINFVRFFFYASLFKSITLYISIIQIFKLPFFLKNFIIFIHYESKTSDENFLGNFTFHHPEIFEERRRDSWALSRLPFSTRRRKMGQQANSVIEPSSTVISRQRNQIKQREREKEAVENVVGSLEGALKRARARGFEMLLRQILCLGCPNRGSNATDFQPTFFSFPLEGSSRVKKQGIRGNLRTLIGSRYIG